MSSKANGGNGSAVTCPECKEENILKRTGQYNRKTGKQIRPLIGYLLAGVFLFPLAVILVGVIYGLMVGNPIELLPFLIVFVIFGAPGTYFLMRMLNMDRGVLLKYRCQDCGHRWIFREDGMENLIHSVQITRPGFMFQRKIPEGLATAPREAHYRINCQHCGGSFYKKIEKPSLSKQELKKVKEGANRGVFIFSDQFRCPQCDFLPTYQLKPGRAVGLMVTLGLFGGILLLLMIVNPPPFSLLVVLIVLFEVPIALLFFLLIRRLLSNRKLNQERNQKGQSLHPAQISVSTDSPGPMKGPAQSVVTGIRFLKSYTKPLPMGKVGTYLEYEADNLEAARRFLANQDVSAQLLYLEVYTPEGGIGKDLGGVYEFEID